MKQPLMLTQSGLPPAQAEALYEAVPDSGSSACFLAGDTSAWPGEDWEDDGETAFPPHGLRPRVSAPFPHPSFKASARH